MNKKYIKISIVLNILIVVLTIFASLTMFLGIRYMGDDILLATSKIGMFKFFTVDSNLFQGIISFIFMIYEIKLLKGSIKELPKILYILKLIATVGVTLTFLTVFGYLGFIVDGGVIVLLKNSNLFFHLITPLLSIITFTLFEKTNKLSFKHTFIGTSSTIIYSIFYTTNVFIHINNGKVDPIYDWYYFVQGGLHQTFFVLPIMLIFSYIISLLLWYFNRRGYEYRR